MSESKTLYISDMDGTLLRNSAKLSDYTKESLSTLIEKGLNFSVATARLLEPVRRMLTGIKVNVPIILMNGAVIYDLNEERYIKYNKINPDVVTTIINASRLHKVTGFMYELKNGVLMTYHETFNEAPPSDYVIKRIDKYKSIQPPNGFSDISQDNIIYFTFIDTQERLKLVYDTLSEETGFNQTLYRNIYSEDSYFLEVFSSETSKQNAVSFLREKYGFNKIIGFGDNHNDLPMFKACDLKVAVGNATTEVKESADYICASNEDDGVAKWLNENFVK
ncbi:MAG: HAD family hydrolase [Defluviitaleaceae bacterium]|nr:HAD family hydrolase [Defluviitaleaceae bacterium]